MWIAPALERDLIYEITTHLISNKPLFFAHHFSCKIRDIFFQIIRSCDKQKKKGPNTELERSTSQSNPGFGAPCVIICNRIIAPTSLYIRYNGPEEIMATPKCSKLN